LISENTLRAVRSRLEVADVEISRDIGKEVGGMKVYRLLDRRMEKERRTEITAVSRAN
jgi:hypothetical protein